MAQASHDRLIELVGEAMTLPAPERAAYVRGACDDPEALREAMSLLGAAQGAGAFLDRPTLAEGRPAAAEVNGEVPGGTIGRYRLLELIGEGGFGRVFMAEQREPVHRRVAVKIIKAGMDTAQVVARFEAERQALAMMDHPGIATVFDGGATESGRPYFVMELVRGLPITAFCDDAKMPIAERLTLFRDVCGAVQHAHQKGVIHRDLKPANVLVAESDGKPQPKIIDFGIAKATSGRLTDRTLFTEFRQFIGTPEYMSPEQALGAAGGAYAGADVDTRSDVYSLGVILYELLTGTTPLERGLLRSGDLAEVQRLIREAEAPRPSTRLSTLATRAHVAAQRRVEPSRLGVLLRGDLDWIVLRTIEKDRNRRYDTVAALSEDVRRYLEHEPVSATPPSTLYRVRKFVRRNRGAVVASSLVAAALVAGIAGTGAGLVAATRQARHAERALGRSRAINHFLLSMLDASRPEVMPVTEAAVYRMNLDIASRQLDSLRSDDPLMEADLLYVIGRGYSETGDYTRAEEMLNRSLDIRRRELGEGAQETIAASTAIAVMRMGMGRPEEAVALLRTAHGRAVRTLGAGHFDSRNILNNLATALQQLNRLPEAEEALRQALTIDTQFDPAGSKLPEAYLNLGFVVASQGRHAEGERIIREAIAVSTETLSANHPDTLRGLELLAGTLMQQGRLDESEAILSDLVTRAGPVMGTDSPGYVNMVSNLFAVRCRLGRATHAAPYLEQVLADNIRARGEDDPHSLVMKRNVGMLMEVQGRHAEAEPVLRDAVDRLRRVRGDAHPHTLSTVTALASVLRVLGKLDEAGALAEEAAQGFAKTSGPDHYRTVGARVVLASVWRDQRRWAESEALLLPTWDAIRESATVTDFERAACARAIAELYERLHGAEPAAGYDARAAEWRAKLPVQRE